MPEEFATISAAGSAAGEAAGNSRSWPQAIWRGARKKCPQCGRGRLFSRYTSTVLACASCELRLDGHCADDASPYITIMIVGHITIPLALAVKQLFDPPLWLQFSIWAPLLMVAALLMLPVSKGAVIGLQWANRMHGFASPQASPQAAPKSD